MEVCQPFGTLIADAEPIYDLNLIDDQHGASSSTCCYRAASLSETARWSGASTRRVVEALELVFAKFAAISGIR